MLLLSMNIHTDTLISCEEILTFYGKQTNEFPTR